MDPSRKPRRRDVWLWQATLVGYGLTLFVATHVPRSLPLLPPHRVDKLLHALAFAILAWLLAEAWQRSAGRLSGPHLRAAWLAVALYAALDELTQIPVGRLCSGFDWLADVVGAAAGLLVFFAWHRGTRRQ